MKTSSSIWVLLLHFFVVVFVVDFMSEGTGGASFWLLSLCLVLGALGPLYRNRFLRALFLILLLIPGICGCYSTVQLIDCLIWPKVIDGCFTQPVNDLNQVGLISVVMGFPIMIILLIQDWRPRFSPRAQLIFSGILLLLLILLWLENPILKQVNDFINRTCSPTIDFSNCL